MTYEQIQTLRTLSETTTELDTLLWVMEELVEEWVTDESELIHYLDELEANAGEQNEFEAEMRNDTL